MIEHCEVIGELNESKTSELASESAIVSHASVDNVANGNLAVLPPETDAPSSVPFIKLPSLHVDEIYQLLISSQLPTVAFDLSSKNSIRDTFLRLMLKSKASIRAFYANPHRPSLYAKASF